jgi:hypothetical protein
MCYTQSRFKALLSACVLSLIATAGWSQSLTWLGTLGGGILAWANGVSADGAVVVGSALRTAAAAVSCLSLDGVGWHARPRRRWAAVASTAYGCFRRRRRGGRLWLTTPQGMLVPFAGRRLGGMQGPRHAAGRLIGARLIDVSADGTVVVGVCSERRMGRGVPFAGRRMVRHARPRHAGRLSELRLMVFPPTAPWWSAGLTNAAGQ